MKKSDISKWNSSLARYRTKCEKISKVSKSVRYVGIINLHGRTLAGKINSGTKPLFSPSQVREEFFAIATAIKLRKKLLHPRSRKKVLINLHPEELRGDLEKTKKIPTKRKIVQTQIILLLPQTVHIVGNMRNKRKIP